MRHYPKLILDPGSTHGGRLSRAQDLIQLASDCGGDAIKWQLCPSGTQNIPLDRSWVPGLIDRALERKLETWFSIWTEDDLRFCVENKITNIKFAYSMRDRIDLMYMACVMGCVTWCSTDLFSRVMGPNSPALNKFWIDADSSGARYPSYAIPPMALLPEYGFHGVSLHHMDAHLIAREALLVYMLHAEVHFCLDRDIDVPDSRFALEPKRLREIRA